jgi:sirohydrochlorin ferrochelatase
MRDNIPGSSAQNPPITPSSSTLTTPLSAHVLLAHGSHSPKIHSELMDLCQSIDTVRHKTVTKGAFLSVGHPNLFEVVQELAQNGVTAIRVQPLFLFSGKHSQEDMPQILDTLRQTHPEIRFEWGALFHGLPAFRAFLTEILTQAPP